MKKICFVTTVSMTLDAFVIETAKYLYENGEYDITFICDYDEIFNKNLPEFITFIPVRMTRGIDLSGFKAVLKCTRYLRRINLI